MPYKGRPKAMSQDKWELFKDNEPAKKAPRKIDSTYFYEFIAKRERCINDEQSKIWLEEHGF